MSDLHTAIVARLDELERLAQTAGLDSGSKRWVPRMMGGAPPDVAEHMATWDPATVLRGLAEDRLILDRHYLLDEKCTGCLPDGEPHEDHSLGLKCVECDCWPEECWYLLGLARRHGVPVPGSDS